MRAASYPTEKIGIAERRSLPHHDKTAQQRADMRYPVKARVDFWWRSGDQNCAGTGTSRDVSEKGAFVLASAQPPIGADVGLTFFLPKLSKAIAAVRMEVEGKVIRVEGEDTAQKYAGFAVLTTAAILRHNGKSNGKNGKNGGKKSARIEPGPDRA
jgi:hypothetical protein